LAINEDQTVHHQKLAYDALQHLASLFDSSIERARDFQARISPRGKEAACAVFGYRGSYQGALLTIWRSSDPPGKRPEMESVKLSVDNLPFEDPVWIDLLTGRVYRIDDSLWTTTDGGTTFSGLAIYDSAIVVAERREVERVLELVEPSI
jgi:hypothetical protein